LRRLTVAVALVLTVAAVAYAGPKGKKYGKHTIHGMKYDKAAIEKLIDDSEVPAEVTADERGVQKLKGKFKLDKSMEVEDAAVDFIDRHRNAFKLKDPKKELKLDEKKVHKEGDTHIYYQQTYNGLPIWQKMATIHLDKNNDIDRISSGNIPTPDIDTTTLVTKEEAVEIVKKGIKDIGEQVDKFDHSIKTGLVIYVAANKPVLCYTVTISTYIPTGSWLFFVDAKKGKIITREPLSFTEGQLSAR